MAGSGVLQRALGRLLGGLRRGLAALVPGRVRRLLAAAVLAGVGLFALRWAALTGGTAWRLLSAGASGVTLAVAGGQALLSLAVAAGTLLSARRVWRGESLFGAGG